MYVGPPDHLTVNQGSSCVSKEMKENLAADGVTVHEAVVGSPGAIGTVERYHAPLRAAFLKLRSDMHRHITDTHCLQLAVLAVNATIGPKCRCPMLLVSGFLRVQRNALLHRRNSPGPRQLKKRCMGKNKNRPNDAFRSDWYIDRGERDLSLRLSLANYPQPVK